MMFIPMRVLKKIKTTMIDNSYYIILNRLKAFANGHYLINTFTYHEIANFDITKNPHYPIMHVVPVSMNPTKGAIDYSFNITFADWVRAKEEKQENEVTVISDLHRCALDLCAEITNGNILFGDEVSINGDAVIEPFIDEFANVLSGVTLQITIRVPYNWSACDIPANWVEGTGDIPDFGGRSLTMDIYDEGDFIVSAREMDFVGEGVTVTYTGNRAIVTITGGGGGVEGVTGNIVDNTDPLNPVVTQVNADWNAVSGVAEILNKPTIPTLTSDLTNDGEDGVNPFITALDIPAQVNSDWNATSGVAEILNKPDLSGFGDMFKSVYDTDNDGIVDKAETIQIIVRNSTGSTLTKGQVVYLSGATGNRPNAVLAQADSEATSSKTIGIVTANIANNSDGNIAVNGTLHDLNTSSFSDGDAVWLSATTAGGITATPPAEPNHTVFIGYIARAHPTQGRIVIAIQNGYELNELHGVLISSPTNNQGLIYNSTSGLWENQNIPNVDLSLISVTSTNAREDNWSPTGWNASTIKVIDFTPNNTNNIISLGGLANPSAGKIVTIVNSSTNNLVIIENESSTSTAANRFKLAQKSPYFLMPEREITFLYTGTRWSQFNTHPNQGGFDFYDDFENLNTTAGSQATKMFYGVTSGAGSGLASGAENTTDWGVMRLTTGTSLGGFLYASVDYRRTGANTIFGLNGLCPQLWVTKVKIDTIPTAAQDWLFAAGLNASSSTVATNGQTGLMWEMPTFASGGVTPAFWNIRITNAVGALTILTATSVPITANTYVYLGIFITSSNNGDAIFFYSTDGITYSFAYRFTRVSGNYGGLPFYRAAGAAGNLATRSASVDWCGESFNLKR